MSPRFENVVVLIMSMSCTTLAADTVIGMQPMNLSKVAVGKFAGFWFEPYSPTPAVARSCYDYCPCSATPRQNTSSCGCDVEKVCGGDISIDLSASSKIEFDWRASSDGKKYITIDGTGRTRIEFQATYDCGSITSPPFQEIPGKNLTYEIDSFDLDGVSQSFTYSPSTSFVIFGKCDGCVSCEIYTRMQFDPKGSEGLKMSFKGIKFSATFDASKVVAGKQQYHWHTNGYCWIRDSEKRRQLGGRILAEKNVYAIVDMPLETLANAAKRSFAHGLACFAIVAGVLSFTK